MGFDDDVLVHESWVLAVVLVVALGAAVSNGLKLPSALVATTGLPAVGLNGSKSDDMSATPPKSKGFIAMSSNVSDNAM